MRYTYVPERPSMSQRLARTAYDAADCRAALRGEKPPLNLGNKTFRLCFVRGVRKHIDFARSPDVTEPAGLPGQEVFMRARNARLIMSNEVPPDEVMASNDYRPYCI